MNPIGVMLLGTMATGVIVAVRAVTFRTYAQRVFCCSGVKEERGLG